MPTVRPVSIFWDQRGGVGIKSEEWKDCGKEREQQIRNYCWKKRTG